MASWRTRWREAKPALDLRHEFRQDAGSTHDSAVSRASRSMSFAARRSPRPPFTPGVREQPVRRSNLASPRRASSVPRARASSAWLSRPCRSSSFPRATCAIAMPKYASGRLASAAAPRCRRSIRSARPDLTVLHVDDCAPAEGMDEREGVAGLLARGHRLVEQRRTRIGPSPARKSETRRLSGGRSASSRSRPPRARARVAPFRRSRSRPRGSTG